jgi:hypothetical protein
MGVQHALLPVFFSGSSGALLPRRYEERGQYNQQRYDEG